MTRDFKLAPTVYGVPLLTQNDERFIVDLRYTGTIPAATTNDTADFIFRAPFDMTVHQIVLTVKTAPTADTTIRFRRKAGSVAYTDWFGQIVIPNGATSATATIPYGHLTASDLLNFSVVGGNNTGTNLRVEVVCSRAYFLPSDISGLISWVRAETNGITDNVSVGTWVDESPAARNFTQATGTRQPEIRTNILNSRPVLRFSDTNNDDMITSTFSWTTGYITIFLVYRPITPTNVTRNIFRKSGSFLIQQQAAGTLSFLMTADQANRSATWGATDTSNFHIYTGRYNKDISQPKVQGWRDGVLTGSDTQQSGNVASSVTGLNLADSTLEGEIAEIILYDSGLTDAQLNTMHEYLSSKYNIPIAHL